MSFPRRDVLKYAAAAPAVLGIGGTLAAMSSATAPPRASAAPLGILLHYAAGVIKAADIKAAGAQGPSDTSRTAAPAGRGYSASPSSFPRRVTCIRAG